MYKKRKVSIEIIVDTREQAPYLFAGVASPEPVVIRHALLTGDYSIAGHESEMCIERKSLPDLFGSLGHGRERFEREFQRMSRLKYAALVIEADFMDCFQCPPEHSRMNPKSVFRSVLAWSIRYGVHAHWCKNRALAEKTTYLILKQYLKDSGK